MLRCLLVLENGEGDLGEKNEGKLEGSIRRSASMGEAVRQVGLQQEELGK